MAGCAPEPFCCFPTGCRLCAAAGFSVSSGILPKKYALFWAAPTKFGNLAPPPCIPPALWYNETNNRRGQPDYPGTSVPDARDSSAFYSNRILFIFFPICIIRHNPLLIRSDPHVLPHPQRQPLGGHHPQKHLRPVFRASGPLHLPGPLCGPRLPHPQPQRDAHRCGRRPESAASAGAALAGGLFCRHLPLAGRHRPPVRPQDHRQHQLGRGDRGQLFRHP